MLIQLLFTDPIFFIAIFIALVISITIHEFSHVLAARLQGDQTGELMGRLNLNPFSHLDPWGTVAILLIGFGWGKPAPFNPYNLKNQRFGPALVALAGPFSNFLLVVVFGFILRVMYSAMGPESYTDNYLTLFLTVLVTFNGVLMIFNLIPLPPLDGSHILEGLLGDRFRNISEFLSRYGARILLILIFISIVSNVSVFSYIIQPILHVISSAFGIPLLF